MVATLLISFKKPPTFVTPVATPVVYEFPDVFPEDITDLQPERDVEFTIYLVLGTRPKSMITYRMFASGLGDLKNMLEEL